MLLVYPSRSALSFSLSQHDRRRLVRESKTQRPLPSRELNQKNATHPALPRDWASVISAGSQGSIPWSQRPAPGWFKTPQQQGDELCFEQAHWCQRLRSTLGLVLTSPQWCKFISCSSLHCNSCSTPTLPQESQPWEEGSEASYVPRPQSMGVLTKGLSLQIQWP